MHELTHRCRNLSQIAASFAEVFRTLDTRAMLPDTLVTAAAELDALTARLHLLANSLSTDFDPQSEFPDSQNERTAS